MPSPCSLGRLLLASREPLGAWVVLSGQPHCLGPGRWPGQKVVFPCGRDVASLWTIALVVMWLMGFVSD